MIHYPRATACLHTKERRSSSRARVQEELNMIHYPRAAACLCTRLRAEESSKQKILEPPIHLDPANNFETPFSEPPMNLKCFASHQRKRSRFQPPIIDSSIQPPNFKIQKTSIYHKFVCHLHLLQHDSTLKKTLHSNVFFEKWNDTEKPKKKSGKRKRELAKDKWYNQMGQVETSCSRGTSGTRRRECSDLHGTSGTRTRGLYLNHSTCPKWGYKAVEF